MPGERVSGNVVVEECLSGPASLVSEWEASGLGTRAYPPFLHPGYVDLWARYLGASARLRILSARRDGQLVGYIPLMETPDSVGRLHVACLRFIGNNVGHPGDILYADIPAADPRREIVAAILRHARSKWRVPKWDLGYLDPRSPTCEIARDLLDVRDEDRRFLAAQPYVSLDLPGGWDAYLEALSARTRKNFRRSVAALSGMGELRLHVHRTPEEAARRVEELIRNHDRWWRGTSRANWFGDAAARAFLVAAARFLEARGEYLAFALELDGSPIAWSTGAFHDGRYYEQLVSFDRTHGIHSPGTTLSFYLIRYLSERGVRRIEMGPGLDQRKTTLGGRATPYPRIAGYPGWLRRIARVRRTIAKRGRRG
ncbi:MAG TPA: GNAT family N-acetyltransferase [Thermoplasmata archaeon]|nr:GNAT family N-acetyltransferase [Thermoplasmata archaeon]